MFRIEKKKEFSSKTLTSICLLSHFSLASMALSRRLERITVISVGSMVSADKSLTLNNQSDKMKMPYNTLQTERRNLYGV